MYILKIIPSVGSGQTESSRYFYLNVTSLSVFAIWHSLHDGGLYLKLRNACCKVTRRNRCYICQVRLYDHIRLVYRTVLNSRWTSLPPLFSNRSFAHSGTSRACLLWSELQPAGKTTEIHSLSPTKESNILVDNFRWNRDSRGYQRILRNHGDAVANLIKNEFTCMWIFDYGDWCNAFSTSKNRCSLKQWHTSRYG